MSAKSRTRQNEIHEQQTGAQRDAAQPHTYAAASGDAEVAVAEQPAYVMELSLGPAPRGLRLARLVAGLILLGVAWLCVALALALAGAALDGFVHPGGRVAVTAFSVIAALWLGGVALASVVTGAFSLSLAIRRTGW